MNLPTPSPLTEDYLSSLRASGGLSDAALANAVPGLLDEIRRLRAENERLTSAVADSDVLTAYSRGALHAFAEACGFDPETGGTPDA